ncbi:dihydrofolate reductase [Paenibacillus baekrokdamisoli]|uniref:Dihydrofolate reductase n=1 Tax=Paenibacillus baekrokdamisoli TaxID=1712516 RepID=A0A3G9J253_9BACL|nr:dihydrofolate reductase [Paenibacillus baekrokdamisoli]MBB3070570.1 dihydrofolate reductase [Paenibacillus baekrokdamisoli]BBH19921.1 dihydrofolate reductase [Paenibacillus baekrokdamisoli]
MSITMIAAMARNQVIGIENAMPWRLPAEMAHFRRSTIDRTVLMGRKTFESLGRPLKDRRNVILTRNAEFTTEGCEIVHSLEEAIAKYMGDDQGELVIMGGAEIYSLFMPYADKLLLTEVDADLVGDAYFPSFDQNEWTLLASEPFSKDEKNAYDFQIQTYVRNKDK